VRDDLQAPPEQGEPTRGPEQAPQALLDLLRPLQLAWVAQADGDIGCPRDLRGRPPIELFPGVVRDPDDLQVSDLLDRVGLLGVAAVPAERR
jgi:hypothetical protein